MAQYQEAAENYEEDEGEVADQYRVAENAKDHCGPP